jgi:PAS domain S-box-containing protein
MTVINWAAMKVAGGPIAGWFPWLLAAAGVAIMAAARVLHRRRSSPAAPAECSGQIEGLQLAAVYRSIGDGVIVCDIRGRVASMNPVAERLCGWTAAEAAGRPLEEVFRIVNAHTLEPAPNPVPRVLAEGVTAGLANDTLLVRRTGETTPIADSCAPILGESGRPIGAVLVFRDVSELYRIQQRLAESERRYRLLTENALAAIAIHEIVRDAEGRAIDTVLRAANARFREESGLNPDELIGKKLSEWLPEAEASRWLARMEAVAGGGEALLIEDDSVRLQRRYLVQIWRVAPDLVGVSFLDVSRIRDAERRAARLGRLLEASSNEVYVFDADTLRFVEASQSALDALGYTLDELCKLTPLDLKRGFSREQFDALLEPLRKGERPWIRFRTHHHRKDGGTYPVEVRLEILDEGPRQLFLAVIENLTEKEEAEQKWRREHDQLVAVVSSARDAIVMLDQDRRVRLWNPAAEDLFGVTADQAHGKCLGRLIALEPAQSETAEAVALRRWLLCEAGQLPAARLASFTASTRSGRRISVELSLAPTEIGGNPHYVAVLRDVSEPVRLRNALADSERWHRALFEQAAIPMAVFDVETLALRESNAAFRCWLDSGLCDGQGLHLPELAASDELHGPADADRLRDAVREARIYGRSSLEWWVGRPGGKRFWCLTTIAQVEDVAGAKLLVSFQDLTARRTAERRLAESEQRYRVIVEHAADLVWTVSRDGRITYASPSWHRVAGYRPEELVGQDFRSGVHPEDLPEAIRILDDLFEGRAHEAALTYRVRHADTSWRWHEGRAVAVRDDEGRTISVVGVSRDVSQRRAAEEELARKMRELELSRQSDKAKAEALAQAMEQLEEARLRAERASQAKTDFLARMSHEMRTPLNAIIGMAVLLMDRVHGLEAEYVEAILSSSRNLLHLIDELLELTAIESGNLRLETEPFSPAQLIDDVVNELGLAATSKGLELLCSIQPETPPVLVGDPRRLRQILTNLVSNAVKYTREGEVRIALGWTKGEPAAGSNLSGKLQICVEDTGPGIPTEKIPLIFEKFLQLEETRTPRAGGVGLGLAIVRQLVDRMGGEITVDSVQGRGTSFRVVLPIQQGPADALPGDGREPGGRVWVLSSRSQRRQSAASLLRWLGADVSEADSLASSLRQLRESQPERAAFLLWEDECMEDELLFFPQWVANLTGSPPAILLAVRDSATAESHAVGVVTVRTPLRPSDLREALHGASVSSLAAAVSDREAGPNQPAVWSNRTDSVTTTGDRPRVLVAEDNILNQRVAAGMLAKLGLEYDIVSDGRQALEALRNNCYDVALIDVSMPEMDGIEVAQAVRVLCEQGRLKRPSLVALTAHVLPEERKRCLEAGMDDFLAKPVSLQTMTEVLSRWIPGWKHHPQR